MDTDLSILAGVDFTSGRQPVTFAALDDALNVVLLERCDVPQAFSHLDQYKSVLLAINTPSVKRGHESYVSFKKKISQAGFKIYSTKSASKQWMEMDAQDCFNVLIGKHPFFRRTLEGRVQRALVLYDQGLHIDDPMDFFEEITRHHMLMGQFPNELLYSASELDALAAAFVAWMAVKNPSQIRLSGRNIVNLPIINQKGA